MKIRPVTAARWPDLVDLFLEQGFEVVRKTRTRAIVRREV
jgi:hypothetical protein